MNSEEKIKRLQLYKSSILEFQKNKSAAAREFLNKNSTWVQQEIRNAGCFLTITVGPPPIVGGMIMRDVNPFDMMFNPPYRANFFGVILDMLEKTIGVIEHAIEAKAAPVTKIPATFIRYASDILAATGSGLSGSEIVSVTASYAVEYDREIPHPTYPFQSPNKRTALYENLMAFQPEEQFRVIRELSEHNSISKNKNSQLSELKIRLATRYGHLSGVGASQINETLLEETRHWLQDHPSSLSLYNEALAKYENRVFSRNLLDDLRLALEKLLQSIFKNQKSLENQIANVGVHIKQQGASPELTNMLVKLIDYYAKYHNSYVKHDDAVIEEEIDFIFEITSSFMKHLVKLSSKS